MSDRDYTILDFIIDNMESEGFHYVGFSGSVGNEILTFKNDAGEIRTVEHGFTPAKPRMNYQYRDISDIMKQLEQNNIVNAMEIVTIKADYSNREK